ncbi:U7 snRNA-associated Sm-like protein LSm10 [Stylophora pistillata]|uniref:U7 snRNA-associated Sm-like protein LSm10 n=1 Tax=Stylophora pistillata TaxID=50429 RepID=UPI000C042573|nr:U7 snRNA-associated Sm-like protein LSm10 [Stylophora pistillata]
MAGGRERAVAERSLVCLLQAVEGHRTIVELRNESSAEGLIENVDGFMNVRMSDVKFTKGSGGDIVDFPTMFIHGRQIRYVQIPDYIDMRKAIEEQLSKLGRTRKPPPRRMKKARGKT